MQRASAIVVRPDDEVSLANLLKSLEPGRRVTFRAGGHSFDTQALGNDVVVTLDGAAFRAIGDVQRDSNGGFFIKTGASATWCDVVKRVSCQGLMPPSLVTAGSATVGGTLSADCLSRMSAIVGKEGQHVRSFRMVLANGTKLDCRRDATGELGELYRAVIGGFGALGAVTEVTFDLTAVRSNPGVHGPRPTVLTRSTRHGANVSWDEVLRSLGERTLLARRTRARRAREGPPSAAVHASEWSALSIASFFSGSGMGANLLEQRYAEPQPLRPAPGGTYDSTSSLTASAQNLATTFPTLVELGLDLGFPDGEFVDELLGWAFFLGNSCARAKAIARKCGDRLNITQQTWILPAVDPVRVDTRPTQRFIEAVEARLHAADIRPTAVDFLYTPADDFLLSASRNLPGFAVTISTADKNRRTLDPDLDAAFRALTHDCRTLGGRVHLVKSVIADPSDLHAMHGEAGAELVRLKQRYDPHGLFRNDFLTRVFGA